MTLLPHGAFFNFILQNIKEFYVSPLVDKSTVTLTCITAKQRHWFISQRNNVDAKQWQWVVS